MTTISSPSPVSTPMASVDPVGTAVPSASTLAAAGTDDTSAYPPEYFLLVEQRVALDAEITSLEADRWRKVGSANVSMTLAAIFRMDEESARDDAIANGEDPPTSSVSSVMSASGRSALLSASDTVALTNQKKAELADVKQQIAAIEAQVNPPPTVSP